MDYLCPSIILVELCHLEGNRAMRVEMCRYMKAGLRFELAELFAMQQVTGHVFLQRSCLGR